MKSITVEHHEEGQRIGVIGNPVPIAIIPDVHLTLTYGAGSEQAAMAALDRAYSDVKRQITGMTTLVPGNREEDTVSALPQPDPDDEPASCARNADGTWRR